MYLIEIPKHLIRENTPAYQCQPSFSLGEHGFEYINLKDEEDKNHY